jgi:hypothetical protein
MTEVGIQFLLHSAVPFKVIDFWANRIGINTPPFGE